MSKVQHDREGCIGCAACVAIYPESWEMADDGKSTLIGGTKTAEGKYEKEISGEEVELHQETAECCPVAIIKVEK